MKLLLSISLFLLFSVVNQAAAPITLDSLFSKVYDIRYSNSDDALKILDSLDNLDLNYLDRGRVYDYKGDIHWYKGELESALEWYNKNLEHFLAAGDSSKLGTVYADLGYTYMDMNRFVDALNMYQKAFNIGLKYKNQDLIFVSGVYKGQLNHEVGNYEQSLIAYNEALESGSEKLTEHNTAILYNNMSNVYVSMEQYETALEYNQRTEKVWLKYEDENGYANYCSSAGVIYKYLNELDRAEEYFNKAIEINIKLGKKIYLAEDYLNLIDINMRRDKLDEAKIYIVKLKQNLDANPHLEMQMNFAQMLSDYYKRTNNSDSAYFYLTKYMEFKDSSLSKDKQQQINFLSAEFDTEKKEYDIKLLKSENDRDKILIEKRNTQLYFSIGGGAVFLILAAIAFSSYRQKQKANNVIQEQNEELNQTNEELAAQRDEIEKQKEKVEEAHQEIKDSINYAKRIQNAILPAPKLFEELLPNSFVLYKPKDVVAGDFYWLEKVDQTLLFAVADCTGHGVPGAMMSVVCHNAINRAVREFRLTKPSEILDKTREIVVYEFEKSTDNVKDGMDIALCAINPLNLSENNQNLEYSGAHNPLWIIRDNEILEFKANRFPIGKIDHIQSFDNQKIDLKSGDMLYLFSDGYADQFGGKEGGKFKTKALKELLLSIHVESLSKQQQILDDSFEKWRGHEEQLDDVCILGVKIA